MNTMKQSKKVFLKICQIVCRAEEMHLVFGDRFSAVLDVEKAHEKFNLDLDLFMDSDALNFAHDFCGIRDNIDRSLLNEGEARSFNGFVPRFARKDN